MTFEEIITCCEVITEFDDETYITSYTPKNYVWWFTTTITYIVQNVYTVYDVYTTHSKTFATLLVLGTVELKVPFSMIKDQHINLSIKKESYELRNT